MPDRLSNDTPTPMWDGAAWFKHSTGEAHLHGVFAADKRVDITPVCGRIEAIGQIQEPLDPKDLTERCHECSQYDQSSGPPSGAAGELWCPLQHIADLLLDHIHEEP